MDGQTSAPSPALRLTKRSGRLTTSAAPPPVPALATEEA
jgi:hypothetical protein